MDVSQLQYFDNVDMLQIGARNMQNFTLLKEVGKLKKPVLLKTWSIRYIRRMVNGC